MKVKKKLPRMREFSCLWYFCGQQKTEKKRNTAKVQKSCEKYRKVPDFLRNQELFGGDYWTRTFDRPFSLLFMYVFLYSQCKFGWISVPNSIA